MISIGGELIARDSDGSDLRLGRQRASFEPVDAEDGPRTRHVLKLLLQQRGIVGQRLDLFTCQHGAERPAGIGRRLLLVLSDGHGGLQLREGQHRNLPVLAAAYPNVLESPRFEPRKLDPDGIAARSEARDGANPFVRRANRDGRWDGGRLFSAGHRD